MKIYKNGVVIASSAGQTNSMLGGSIDTAYIGYYKPSHPYYFVGALDDFRIYSQELDIGMINAIYENGL